MCLTEQRALDCMINAADGATAIPPATFMQVGYTYTSTTNILLNLNVYMGVIS